MPQYTYDKSTGKQHQKQESPLQPGVYLQPANSVDTAPPSFDESTHIAKWSDETNTWTVEEIYIGPYNSRQEEIDDLSSPQATEQIRASIDPMELLRSERGSLLAETDIFATISVDGPAMPESVRTYRQALRDLPSNVSNPQVVISDDNLGYELSNVTWPNVPQEVLDRR